MLPAQLDAGAGDCRSGAGGSTSNTLGVYARQEPHRGISMMSSIRTAYLLLSVLSAQGCQGTSPDVQSLREFLATRSPSIVRIGRFMMPPAFTDPEKVALLSAGLEEAEILEIVGQPERRVPTAHGERWLWETEVITEHVVLAVDVVGGRQQGDALWAWTHLPVWLDPGSRLQAGMESTVLFDKLGTPLWWVSRGRSTTVGWEATVNLMRDATGQLRYTDTPYRHSLTLEVASGMLVAAALPVQVPLRHEASSGHDQGRPAWH